MRRLREVAFISVSLFFIIVLLFVLESDCVVEKRKIHGIGQSLHGVFENGDPGELAVGYYRCHVVERGDIVGYQYAESQAPIAKIVRGIPGDHLEFRAVGNLWHLNINNATALTTRGESYLLDSWGVSMLQSYVEGSRNIIPQDTYLLLGNLSSGTLDSTRFGLIAGKDILGKISAR
jgi:signal peptidase I